MCSLYMDGRMGVNYLGILLLLTGLTPVLAQNNGDLRFGGINSNATQGRVEIFYAGVWGTVCDDGFNTEEAIVVCRQMGVADPFNGEAVTTRQFGNGTGDILMDDVVCRATEQRLQDCRFGGWGNSNCHHGEDIGVICHVTAGASQSTLTPPTTRAPVVPDTGNCTIPDTNIRLIGPANMPGVGVVQMRQNNVWGGVCDNNWDLNNAKVVCRMLCFDPAKALPGSVAFDTSNISQSMTVNNVNCNGNEDKITDCDQSAWAENSCGNNEMAKVTCVELDNSPPKKPEPLLDCSNGLLSASFARSRDPYLEEKHLSVAVAYTGPCNPVLSRDNEFITIGVPFDECGTNMTYNDTHIIYNTAITYLPTSSTGVISNDNTYTIYLQCEMPRVVFASKPIVPQTEVVTQVAPGSFIINMHFFRNNTFTNPITQFPLEIPVGRWLNTAIELQDVDENLKLVVPNCYATPSTDKNDPVQYSLFTNKCPDDATVGFFPLNETWFGYRFQTFKFRLFTEVHIHCDAYICDKEDASQQCDRSCFPTTTTSTSTASGRRKRSVEPRYVYVSSRAIIVYETGASNELIRPSIEPTTKEMTTESPIVTTRITSAQRETNQSQNVVDIVTHYTEHVTQREPEESLINADFIVGSSSNLVTMSSSCFVIIFITFMLHVTDSRL